jgi:hypothetical protein
VASDRPATPVVSAAASDLAGSSPWKLLHQENRRSERLLRAASEDDTLGLLDDVLRESRSENEFEAINALEQSLGTHQQRQEVNHARERDEQEILLAAAQLDLLSDDLLEDLAQVEFRGEVAEAQRNARADSPSDLVAERTAQSGSNAEARDRQSVISQASRFIDSRGLKVTSARDPEIPPGSQEDAELLPATIGQSNALSKDLLADDPFGRLGTPPDAPPRGVMVAGGQILKTDGACARLQAFDLGTTPTGDESADAS